MNSVPIPLAVVCGTNPPKEALETEEQLGMSADQLAQLLSAATRTANYHTRPPPSEDRSHDRKASSDRFRLTCLAPSSLSTSSSASAAASLVKASGLVSSIHLGVFFRAFMQNNVIITGEVLEQLIAMCVSNEPEWVHKVQQTALAFIFDLMESRGDSSVLQRFLGTLVHIPMVGGPSSYASSHHHASSSSSSSSVSVDDIAFLAQLKNHSTIVNASTASGSSCPDIVVSCPHFRFIIDANSIGTNDSVDFSAQVRITNTGKCPVNVRVAQEVTVIDGVTISGGGDIAGVVVGNDPAGAVTSPSSSSLVVGSGGDISPGAATTPKNGGSSLLDQATPERGAQQQQLVGASSSQSPSASSPSVKAAHDNAKFTDTQILLERAYLKKGESSRLLVSFVAKSSATFSTYTKLLVLMVHETIKVVVSFVVINPMQPVFGVPFPLCIPQPVVDSPLGSFEAPIILQVIKHHFQLMGGFGWREVGALFATSGVNPHARLKAVVHDPSIKNREIFDAVDSGKFKESHFGLGAGPLLTLNQKVMKDAIALRNRLCDEWPCGALLPRLWQHGLNGSTLTHSVFGVPSPVAGLAPSPANASAVHFVSQTSSTLKTRVSVPVSSSNPIGYAAGAVRPSKDSAGYNNTRNNKEHTRTLSSGGGVVGGTAGTPVAAGASGAADAAAGSALNPTTTTTTDSAIPSSCFQQVLVNSALRLEALTSAQPQTLFALVLLWFAEFPTPLLDRSLTMCDPCVYLDTMQPHLQHLLVWLIDFCCCFLVNAETNGSTIRNLALTFAPLIMDHNRCVPPPRQQDGASSLQSASTAAAATTTSGTQNKKAATAESNSKSSNAKATVAPTTSYTVSNTAGAFHNSPSNPTSPTTRGNVNGDDNGDGDAMFGASLSSPPSSFKDPYGDLDSSTAVMPSSGGGGDDDDAAKRLAAADIIAASSSPAASPLPPRDALANDVTFQLHCTTAMIHWLKKYHHLYQRAAPLSGGAAAATTTSNSSNANSPAAKPLSRPLSPMVAPAAPSF